MSLARPLRMLIGFSVGIVGGLLCHFFVGASPAVDAFVLHFANPLGQIFLRMIFAVVVPLVFSSLVLGVFELGDVRSVGRVGWKTLLFTLITSLASVIIGLALVWALKPGAGLSPEIMKSVQTESADSQKVIQQAQSTKPFAYIIAELIPKNPIAASVNALEGEMLSLMVFALLFGLGLVAVRGGGSKDPMVGSLETLRDVSMKLVDFAMMLAPYGVAALVFSLTARFGWELVLSLGKYVGVVVLGLCIQQFLVFGVLLKVFARKGLWQFLYEIREVLLTAFSTASSNATLPTTLKVAEKELGLNRKISSFVLTIGSTANQNGTALFEGVTILFLAQVFQVDLSFVQQVTVLLMSVLAGIGTAGVPGGSIPLIVIVLRSVGIPAEGIGIILGVDRFLDMCRTVLNVSGDLVIATLVDKSEE